jgi:hypothetical protein
MTEPEAILEFQTSNAKDPQEQDLKVENEDKSTNIVP